MSNDYIVPPKQIVVQAGRIYGAGMRVPGYHPPAEKIKKQAPEPVKTPVEEPASEPTNTNTTAVLSAAPEDKFVKRRVSKRTYRRKNSKSITKESDDG